PPAAQQSSAVIAPPVEIKTLETQKLSEVSHSAKAPETTFAQAVRITGATKTEETQEPKTEPRSPASEPLATLPASGSQIDYLGATQDQASAAATVQHIQQIRPTDLIPGAISAQAVLLSSSRQPVQPASLTIRFIPPKQ
ncbi:MAG: hypothetical protein KGQ59_11415, partial [Bdellovibrionales bacterium]|nr:hypothetical protein [Bdellovibrionales bacterium]